MDHRHLAVGAAALGLALTAGCGTSRPPDDGAWRGSSVQALEDVAGSVGTGQLALDQEIEDRLAGRAALVLLQDAEDAAGTATRGYATSQPAPGRADDARALRALLREAGDVLVEARIAVAAGDDDAYAGLVTRLQDVQDRLDAAAAPLKGPAG